MNMEKRKLPKTQEKIEKVYNNCEKHKKFREINKDSFSDYLIRSQKDIASAENDLKNGDYYWARIKAYQSLFHMLNALLVKNFGYYSKDHGCILAALLKENIINQDIARQLYLIVESIMERDTKSSAENFIQDIDYIRIQRNFALYKPKAWEEVTKEDIENELNKIKHNLKILGGLL